MERLRFDRDSSDCYLLCLSESDAPSDGEISTDSCWEFEENIHDEILVQRNNENEEIMEFYETSSGFKWFSKPTPITGNVPPFDISSCGAKAPELRHLKDVFKLFIDDEIMEEICHYTNLYGKRLYRRINKNKWKNLTTMELEAWIGIIIVAGRNYGHRLHSDDMWSENELFCHPFYPATMSRLRFQEIYTHIRFDDPRTRRRRMANSNDKLEAVRAIIDKLNNNFGKYYVPSSNLNVNNRLCRFKGQCPFRVYMKNNGEPCGKYGIKICTCADSQNSFICRFTINTDIKEEQCKLVLNLLKPYYGTGREVTVANCFTSVKLAEELLEKGMLLTGALRATEKEVPRDFLAKNMSAFNGNLCLTSTPSEAQSSVNSILILLTSNPKIHTKTSISGPEQPEVFLHYNITKDAVAEGERTTLKYSSARRTNRWTLRLFFDLIDMVVYNTYLLYADLFPGWNPSGETSLHRKFIQELAQELASDNVRLRFESGAGNESRLVRNALNIFIENFNKPQEFKEE